MGGRGCAIGIVWGECKKFVEKLYIDLTTADIGVILHPFRHPAEKADRKENTMTKQTESQYDEGSNDTDAQIFLKKAIRVLDGGKDFDFQANKKLTTNQINELYKLIVQSLHA